MATLKETVASATEELIEDIKANKKRWQDAITKEPSEILEISVDGTPVTSSNLKEWKTYIPVVYVDLMILRNPPSPNVSAGLKGGGSIILQPASFIIYDTATIGVLSSGALAGRTVDFKLVELHTADGKTTEASIYESKKCPVLTNVTTFAPFKYFFLMLQNIDFKEYKYDETGVKDGVGAQGHYDAAQGTAG